MKHRLSILIAIFLFIQHTHNAIGQQRSIVSNFAAQRNGAQINLAWTITAGNTCNGISIFRIIDSSSQKIGELYGVCGNSSAPQQFSFVDSFPIENKVNSYQLELGGVGSSGIASILFLKPSNFILFPNPAKEKLSIIFGNDGNNPTVASIVNSSGVTVRTLTTNARAFEINIDDLADGVYYISIYIQATGFLKRDQFIIMR